MSTIPTKEITAAEREAIRTIKPLRSHCVAPLPKRTVPLDPQASFWVRHDRSVGDRLTNLSAEIAKKTEAGKGKIFLKNRGNVNKRAAPAQALRMKAELAKEWLDKAEEIYRETWRQQGHKETPEFLRAVRARVIEQLQQRAAPVKSEFRRSASRQAIYDHEAYLKHFEIEIQRLTKDCERRFDSEARNLEIAARNARQSSVGQSDNAGRSEFTRARALGGSKVTPLEDGTQNHIQARRTVQGNGTLELGKWADELLPEIKLFSRQLLAGKKPEDLRPLYVRLFDEVFDQLPAASQKAFFDKASKIKTLTNVDLAETLADVKGKSGATLLDHRKKYRASVRK